MPLEGRTARFSRQITRPVAFSRAVNVFALEANTAYEFWEIGSALVDLYGQTCEVRPVMEMDVPPDL